jgi:PBP1b-binding outer membrane lipoprotein LpoB
LIRKTAIFVLVTLALLLSACGSLTPPPASTQEAQLPTQEQTSVSVATQPVATTTPACRVDTSAQPDPTQEALFPQVGEQAWAQGPETARVRIIEYSDFQ